MRVFLIAGEASGDGLGAALMAGLARLRPEVEFTGVGGPQMHREGLRSLFPMDEISVMGLAEILPRYANLRRRIKQVARSIIDSRPDVVVSIDSPDFCLRVLKIVRRARPEIPTVHYVAPSVWAWRAGRAKKMAPLVDHVLALLPFEPPLMEAAGMGCTFVGHPVVADPVVRKSEALAFRQHYGIDPNAPLLMVLPGSRMGEVTRLAPIFGEAVKRLLPSLPSGRAAPRVIVPSVGERVQQLLELTESWPGEVLVLPAPEIGPERKRAAFAAADLALAASGTVSLELAAQATPMVVGYQMSPISQWLIRRMLKIDTVTLVNLVSETRAVPEFLGADCTPEKLAGALLELVVNPEQRAAQQRAMTDTMLRLGRGGEAPGLRAARAVLKVIEEAR